MRQHIRCLLPLLAGMLLFLQSYGQQSVPCTNNNVFQQYVYPNPYATFYICDAGEYVLLYVVAGNEYVIATCDNSGFDTQITVFDSWTGEVLAYNDDNYNCNGMGTLALQSAVTLYTYSTDYWVVAIDEYYCQNSGRAANVSVLVNPYGPPRLAAPDSVQAAPGQPPRPFVIFPNPTDGPMTVHLDGLSGERATINITDVQGRIVRSETALLSSGLLSTNIDLSGESPGMYVVQIHTENEVLTKRICVH